MPAAYVGAVVLGIGFGAYTAVDFALITEVLPEAADRAKDLGVINIANALPQVLAPVLAAAVLGLGLGYPGLYLLAAAVERARLGARASDQVGRLSVGPQAGWQVARYPQVRSLLLVRATSRVCAAGMDLTPYDDPADAVGVAFRLTRRRLRAEPARARARCSAGTGRPSGGGRAGTCHRRSAGSTTCCAAWGSG